MNSFTYKATNFVSALAVSLTALGGFSASVFANDALVFNTLEEATALYAHRSATDSKPIDSVIEKLSSIEGKAEDSDLNYKVLILESRALYWKGVHMNTNEEKMSVHALGQEKADQAKQLNDGYADAYYFAGINLARWGEAKGVLGALSRKNELISYMNEAMNRMTIDDQAGESIDGDGPHRVLGRVYFKLPAIFGGSHTESVKHLKKTYDDASSLALNVVYYAETLDSGNASEKALAKKVLDKLLEQDPNTLDPTRVQETVEEFELARKLRAQMN